MSVETIQEACSTTFKGLEFEEDSHVYTYFGKRPPSVSKLVKGFAEKVDFAQIAVYTAKRDGKKPEEVQAEWKNAGVIACVEGKDAHSFAEDNNLLSVMPTKIVDTPQKRAILSFWKSLPQRYLLVAKELKMVHLKYMYCGTCDVLLYDTITGKLVIVDYKTNKDLYKNYRGKLLLPPFNDLLDNPFNLYQLQLSYYQILVEQIGYEVSERWIIWAKRDGTFDKLECANFTQSLRDSLEKYDCPRNN